MIDYLKGTITNIETEYVVMEISGIGYRVFCPQPIMLAQYEQENIQLHIHDYIREDAHVLYGFLSKEERALFKMLLEVSGVGPKVALGVIAGGSPQTVKMAIVQENLFYLMKLPGIGKKTAQRIVLDLKDKLGPLLSIQENHKSDSSDVKANNVQHNSTWIDAKEALMNWGYSEAELQKTWIQMKDHCKESDPVDVWMKNALQILNKS